MATFSHNDSLEGLEGPRNCYSYDCVTAKGFKIKSAKEKRLPECSL